MNNNHNFLKKLAGLTNKLNEIIIIFSLRGRINDQSGIETKNWGDFPRKLGFRDLENFEMKFWKREFCREKRGNTKVSLVQWVEFSRRVAWPNSNPSQANQYIISVINFWFINFWCYRHLQTSMFLIKCLGISLGQRLQTAVVKVPEYFQTSVLDPRCFRWRSHNLRTSSNHLWNQSILAQKVPLLLIWRVLVHD